MSLSCSEFRVRIQSASQEAVRSKLALSSPPAEEDSECGPAATAQSGSPTRCGMRYESFNGRLRDEYLNANCIRTRADARHCSLPTQVQHESSIPPLLAPRGVRLCGHILPLTSAIGRLGLEGIRETVGTAQIRLVIDTSKPATQSYLSYTWPHSGDLPGRPFAAIRSCKISNLAR